MAFQVHQEQFLSYPIEQAFRFFASPENLNLLTPPWANFSILSPQPIEMAVGTIIEYRIRLRGVPGQLEERDNGMAASVRVLRRAASRPLPVLGPPAHIRGEAGWHPGD